jgi:hypothetical protein
VTNSKRTQKISCPYNHIGCHARASKSKITLFSKFILTSLFVLLCGGLSLAQGIPPNDVTTGDGGEAQVFKCRGSGMTVDLTAFNFSDDTLEPTKLSDWNIDINPPKKCEMLLSKISVRGEELGDVFNLENLTLENGRFRPLRENSFQFDLRVRQGHRAPIKLGTLVGKRVGTSNRFKAVLALNGVGPVALTCLQKK